MQFQTKWARQHRDAGMTLPELLVSVTLTAILATTLAVATNVMLSNRDNTMGRANNSRSEQNVGLFMPTDLASSESEDTDPAAVPCGPTPACPPEALIEGSNALLLTWTSSTVVAGNPVTTTTKVSYRVALVGSEYQLIRVKCDAVGTAAPTCTTQIVLHDLTPPSAGVTFIPGFTKPDWIITVSKATDPLDTSGATATPVVDPGLKNKNGQRVVVTVNGGGGGSSASGGQSQIFLSAGGTNREANLSTEDLSGAPTFTAARSRCGGNIGMIVDTSNSITNTQMASIKGGIRSFLDEFAGTPVKLQIVTFSTFGTILGSSAAGEPKWYDMLVDSDVTALKNLIGDPANAASGIKQNGGTNWEDGFIRMLRNVDGTIPAQMPSKVIFFTDGVPTYSRINSTSSTAAVTVNPLDAGLPASTGSTYAQIGWNRAERVVRDRGKVDVIGIFVGTLPTDTTAHTPSGAYSNWTTASAGYHIAYDRANTVVYQKGYHLGYQRGNNVVYERGSHAGYQVGNNVVWERGYHSTYQRGNNVVYERAYHLDYQRGNTVLFQYATTGVAFEKSSSGGSSGSWSSESVSNYLNKNNTPDSTDGHRIRVTGTLGGWTNMTSAQYDDSNSASGQTEGVRTTTSGSATSWVSISAADYNLSNTTTDATDGFQTAKVYTAPFDTFESTTQALYETAGNNSVAAETDGWRTRQTAASTSWTNMTLAQYNASNLTPSDATDGWQELKFYSSPYDSWESTTQATYDTAGNNSVAAATDGWRTRQTATSTSWTTVTTAQYNASNLTADATDGWQPATIYSAPYDTWSSTTQATYDTAGNNSTVDSSDGWRTRQTATSTTWTTVTLAQYNASNSTADASDGWQTYNVYGSSPYDLWETTTQTTYDSSNSSSASTDGWRTFVSGTPVNWTAVTQTQYNASNTTTDDTDGWRTYKSYTAPFTTYDVTTKPTSDIDLLGNVVVGDLTGNTGSYNRVDAPAGGAPYPDNAATAADVFALPDYSYFAQALDKIVLGECGGTVTLQTKNTADNLGAKDPFTYQNSTDNTVVKTSSSFKSGTFDVAFPGENAKTITITPQEFTNLSAWSHVSWSCKSKGAAYPFTETPVPDHTAWTKITLVVHANEAISCTQMVSYHG